LSPPNTSDWTRNELNKQQAIIEIHQAQQQLVASNVKEAIAFSQSSAAA
jgi:hypothetical protein